MNKRGMEGITIGALIMMFVVVVLAVSLLTGGITQGVGTLTTKDTVGNQTFVFPKNTTSVTLRGQAATGVVVTLTNGSVLPSTHYTITNYVVSSTGVLSSTITGVGLDYNGSTVEAAYTSEPLGYDTSPAGRSVAGIIIILTVLALAIAIMVPVIRNGIIDFY